MTNKIKNTLKAFYQWLNTRTNGAVHILRVAVIRFNDTNSTQSAAGMAYYAFFSLFPLLLFLVVGASYILEIQSAYDYVMEYVYEMLPAAGEIIDANIQQVLASRGAVGILGLVAFLWSSSSFFSILARIINRANPNYEPRNFIEDRVVALLMIGLLALLLALSLLSNTITNLLPQLDIFYWKGIPLHETMVWRYFVKLIPFFLTFLLFISLYRFIPRKKIGWKGILIAALLASISWQLVTRLFAWLLQQGLVKYELVYGSLGAIVALMFWIYLISVITIFGAHLSAVIENQTNEN